MELLNFVFDYQENKTVIAAKPFSEEDSLYFFSHFYLILRDNFYNSDSDFVTLRKIIETFLLFLLSLIQELTPEQFKLMIELKKYFLSYQSSPYE